MLLFSFSKKNRDFRKIRCLLTILTVGALCSAVFPAHAANMIQKITTESTESTYTIIIQGTSEPVYTTYELFDPSRIVLDIANASIAELQDSNLAEDLPFSLATSTVSDSDPGLSRFEFTFKHDQDYVGYDVTAKNNNVIVSVNLGKATFLGQRSLANQLPQVDLELGAVTQKTNPPSPAGNLLQQNFNFGGNNNQRISVDFYKIDLHNVFRLIREVSQMNIVVDESVSGSLTLALNDVPWDYALDIIVNLKDLTKEEQYNTIVIHPKSKTFDWPERAEDNFTFETNEGVVAQEAIVIQQQEILPQSIIDAKKIMSKARQSEQSGNMETAVKLYESALEKWPENSKLTNKIAAIYLVQLRLNAKAAYFADKALTIDSGNSGAALNAAIAYANMNKKDQAQRYFNQSVSVSKPTSEALLSYAVFSERQDNYDAAIKLLLKHDDIYGENLNSMVARGRILDKKGEHESATEAYKAILLAGFRLPPDLRKYITGRITLNQSM